MNKLLSERLERLNQEHSLHAHKPSILAVSKGQTTELLRTVYASGQHSFGENYLQEALEKIDALNDLNIHWHFIGPIQSNKCKSIAEHFHWVQSIDRRKVAAKLNECCPNGKNLQVCIQVNIDNDPDKSGIDLGELDEICAYVDSLENLNLRGLMTIPKASKSVSEQRASFAKLAERFYALQKQFPDMDTLSMGMSGDYQIALEEGATLTRIGTGLFGPRKQ